ncbi:MAG: 4-hydroxy-tetrahydrodipicolinate synthase [Bdellovibrionota bacterium]
MQILSNTNSFKGIFTAIVTPFSPDGSIDWRGYERLVDLQLDGGVHGIVSCGTTGESPTLSSEEKQSLIEFTVRKCAKRALVIAGTGGNETQKTVLDSKKAAQAGADAVLVVTPYYNKPSQAGLEAHFKAVADECPVPVILYNVPGRTGVSLAADTVGKLSQHPQIVGIKEATGNLNLLTEMKAAVAARPSSKPFYFLSGDDPTFWPFLACGGDGVISVASNILPRCMRVMYEDWNEGRIGGGLSLHERLLAFFNTLFIEPNPVPVKAVLSWEHQTHPRVRLPLVEMQQENGEKLKAVWNALLPHLKKDRPREDLHG